MDLMILDNDNQPTKLVENYDSLIWTERYNQTGDVTITTGDVHGFMNLLPEGTRVALRESAQTMVIERHLIERKKNSREVLTITGRSFDSILDRRVALSAITGNAKDWTFNVKTPADAAYYIINKICVEGILSSLDIFPSSQVVFTYPEYLTSTAPAKEFSVPKGNLLSAVQNLLSTEARSDGATPAIFPHGMQALRPNPDGTAVNIRIYKGSDVSDRVYFDGSRDLLDDGQYLFSKEGSATVGYVSGPSNGSIVEKFSDAPSGLDRRVIFLDETNSGVSSTDALRSRVELALTQANETALFDGSINQDLSPYVFGRDYYLGDIVRLVGDYGMDRKALVTEYIRSDDQTGAKSYPTLVSMDSERES